MYSSDSRASYSISLGLGCRIQVIGLCQPNYFSSCCQPGRWLALVSLIVLSLLLGLVWVMKAVAKNTLHRACVYTMHTDLRPVQLSWH